ncbi:MAG: asparaginase [bacterium]|nr:asparaginase [bacterium]
MKKKILIVSYGGTIVMVVDEGKKAIVPANNIEEIFENVPRLGEYADVDFEILSNVDSTNVTPDDWTRIALFLSDKMDEYDGFVITHGTNTMAYTASALALALGRGLKKPVVMTGSQLPLMVYGNDARFNLENAVKTAALASTENISEVMIVFNDVILRGARSVKISESSFNAFTSPSFPVIGNITSRGIQFNQYAHRIDENTPFEMKPHFQTGILTVDLVPGQLPGLIEEVLKSGKCKGVILKSHGAGSVPTVNEYSFIPIIEGAVQKYQVPILISTKFLGGNPIKDTNDEPAVEAQNAGAIPTGDMTDVMAEVKLMWLLAQGFREKKTLEKEILRDYIGEITV